MNNKAYSWGPIIVMMILFFPVGVWLLVKKITAEKSRYIQNGKSLRIFALILFCMIPVYIILGITGELQYTDGSSTAGMIIVMTLVLGIGGAFAFRKGKQYIQRGQYYSCCISLLSSQQAVEIDPIAAELNITYEEASADLQGMIDEDYIKNAYIDHIRRCLVAKQIVRPTRAIICQCCGAKNEFEIGTAAKCEYCDSPLQI